MAVKGVTKILFVGDVHAPYESVRGFKLVLKVAQALKPDVLVLTGDTADFYAVSSHSKDPERAGRLKEEVEYVNRNILDPLDALGFKKKHWISGNHSDRLRRYLADRAGELDGLIDVPGLFRLKERGYSFTPYKQDMRIGKLHITHDVGSAGRYNIFKCLDTYQGNIVTGHTHRLSYVVEGNAKGEHMVSAQFGWMGDESKIDYMAAVNVRRNWSLGFGLGYLDEKTRNVFLTPCPIVNYSVVCEGILYRG